MYNRLLEEKPKNSIEKKLKYWIQIWNELINNFNKNSFGLKFENAHTIIEELLEEIEFNHLQNTLNKKFFIEKLGKTLKEDIVIRNNFNLEIKNLIENLNSDKNEYINVICINIDRNIFKSKKYISLLLKNIKEIIINEDEKNYNDIKNLTKSIIIEFIMFKYNSEYIRLIIKNIFDTYIEHDGHVITNLPINSDLDNDKLKAYINNLSIGDRIDLIEKYIEKESEELYIICKLNGFKAVNRLICGDVEFYNPKFKNHIAISNFISDEEIREQYENWNCENIVNIPHYYNAIVKVKAKSNYQAFKEAERKIELVFNTIRCCYPSEYKFSLCKENYYILDKEKNFIGESSSLPENYHDEYEFYRENDDTFIPKNEYLQNILKSFSQFMYNDSKEYNETQRKIISSLAGFRKANENEKLEEKLLNYWICIENLMNIKTEKNKNLIINKGEESVFTLAREIIPSFYIGHSTKTFFQELYYYIYNLCIKNRFTDKGILEYDEETMTKFKFNCTSGSINLTLFINGLAELESLTKDQFVKEKLIYANKLLTDNNYSIKILNENKKEIENDILEIYRYRNMIVHDAHFNEQFLQYYVKLSEKYARYLLLKVVDLYCKNRDKLVDILLQEHLNFKMLLLNLDQNKDIPLKEYVINNKL